MSGEWATEAALRRARQMWDQGASFSTIATAIGTTKNALIGKSRRLNWPARQSPIIRTAAPKKPRAPRRAVITLAPMGPSIASAATSNPISGPTVEGCQWALNDSRPWRFCGAPCVSRRSYDGSRVRTSWCAEHYARVYARRCEAIAA